MLTSLEGVEVAPTNWGLRARLQSVAKPNSRQMILYDLIHIHLEDYDLTVDDRSSPLFIGFIQGIYCALQQITSLDFGIDEDTVQKTDGLRTKLKFSEYPSERRSIARNWMDIHIENFGMSSKDLRDPRYNGLLSVFYNVLHEVTNLNFDNTPGKSCKHNMPLVYI